MTCNDCRFYEFRYDVERPGAEGGGQARYGICRRYPPMTGGWAPVHSTDWCGEYQIKKEAPPLAIMEVSHNQCCADNPELCPKCYEEHVNVNLTTPLWEWIRQRDAHTDSSTKTLY